MTTATISVQADALANASTATRSYKQLLQAATIEQVDNALEQARRKPGKNKTRIALLESRLTTLKSGVVPVAPPTADELVEAVGEAVAEVIDEPIEVVAEAVDDAPPLPAAIDEPKGITESVAFTIESAALARAAKNLRPFAAHPSHAVLNAIHIETCTDGVRMIGFNLSNALQVNLAGAVRQHGEMLIPAEFLYSLSASLPAGPVEIIWDAEGGYVYFKSSVGTHSIRSLPADDFPALPTIDGSEYSVPMDIIQRAAKCCSASISRDDTKQVLTCLRVSSDGKSTEFASTDGHRLSVMSTAIAIFPKDFGINIPRAAVAFLAGLANDDESIDVTIGGSDYTPNGELLPDYQYLKAVNANGTVFITRLFVATYPNYQQLIPRQFASEVRVTRSAIRSAAIRAGLCDRSGVVRLNFSAGSVAIEARAEGLTEAAESMPCTASMPIDIAFNAAYLNDACAHSEDEVVLRMNSPKSPAVVEVASLGYTHLLMPVQLRH
jgi:DNA polymerase III subunit beta